MTGAAPTGMSDAGAHDPVSSSALPIQALDRGNASGRATRERLMILAERMFAEDGIEAVSLRAIGQAAGQRNNNVVQYHFGDRTTLVGAIYAFRSAQLDARRSALLAAHRGAGAPDDARTSLRILLQPHVESIPDDDNFFVPFLARLVFDRGSIADASAVAAQPFMGAHNQLRRAVRDTMPHVTDSVFAHRFDMLLRFAITELAVHKRFGARDDASGLAVLADTIVGIMAAGLAAPMT